MGNYASSSSDIASEFKSITFGASTPITSTEVDGFITQAEAMVDSYVGKRYSTPISSVDSPISFSIVKMLTIWMVADRVRGILEVKRISDETPHQDTRRGLSYSQVIKELEKISNEELDLPDATLVSPSGLVRSYASDNALTHQFKKDVDQW